MVVPYILKRVGLYRAYRLTVYEDIEYIVAVIWNDGESDIVAAFHSLRTIRSDSAVLSGCRHYFERLKRELGHQIDVFCDCEDVLGIKEWIWNCQWIDEPAHEVVTVCGSGYYGDFTTTIISTTSANYSTLFRFGSNGDFECLQGEHCYQINVFCDCEGVLCIFTDESLAYEPAVEVVTVCGSGYYCYLRSEYVLTATRSHSAFLGYNIHSNHILVGKMRNKCSVSIYNEFEWII